jgi:hypothetical protein
MMVNIKNTMRYVSVLSRRLSSQNYSCITVGFFILWTGDWVSTFWRVTPCGLSGTTNVSEKHAFSPSTLNVGSYLQVHTASCPRRTTSTLSPPWQPQISHGVCGFVHISTECFGPPHPQF